MSLQRTLEQERAKKAWAWVNEVKGQSYAKEYGSLARGAPANIQVNGLGQTLAFWRAKGFERGKPKNNGNNAPYQLFNHVSTWVGSCLKLKAESDKDLLSWIINAATTDEYRRATAEAMAFLSWLKRFAEAELGDDK